MLTTKPVYDTKVKALEAKYKSAIRKAKIVEKTYIGDPTELPSDFPTDVSGVILIQYTPYQELRNGKQGALARVYYENNPGYAAYIECMSTSQRKLSQPSCFINCETLCLEEMQKFFEIFIL